MRFPRWMHALAFAFGIEDIGKPEDYLRFWRACRRNLV